MGRGRLPLVSQNPLGRATMALKATRKRLTEWLMLFPDWLSPEISCCSLDFEPREKIMKILFSIDDIQLFPKGQT